MRVLEAKKLLKCSIVQIKRLREFLFFNKNLSLIFSLQIDYKFNPLLTVCRLLLKSSYSTLLLVTFTIIALVKLETGGRFAEEIRDEKKMLFLKSNVIDGR